MSHDPRLGSLLFLFAIILANGTVPVLAGSTTGLMVLITYPDQEYTIDCTATVYVHVFQDKDYIDPDSISVNAGESLFRVPVERERTGLYRASFVIKEYEMKDYYFQVDADVWNGGESAFDGKLIFISDYPSLDVEVVIEDPSDITPVPGQTVEFVVRTTSHGGYVDIDPGTLSAYARNDPAPNVQLEVTREDTGIYRGSFKVPEDREIYGSCRLIARAQLTTGRFTTEGVGGASIFIRTFDVWYRYIEVGVTNASIDFYVIDLNGNPLPGASLSLASYHTRIDKVVTETWHNLTTDDDGRARMELVYDNISSYEPESPVVYFNGNATYRELNQYVWGFVFVEGAPIYEREDRPRFEVELLDDFYLPMGTEMNLSYVARFDNVVLAGQDLFGRVYGDHGIYWFGNVSTGADGSFHIEFTTPATMAAVDGYEHLEARFGTWVNGTLITTPGTPSLIVRSHDHTWESRAERCPITFFQVTEGPGDREYQINLQTDGADGVDETAWFLWNVGLADSDWDHGGEHIFFSNDGTFDFSTCVPLPMSWDDGAYRTILKVPDFIPPGTNLYAIGIVKLFDGPISETRYAYIANISAFLVDLPPSVRIDSPVNGSVYRGEVLAAGTATDDHGVRTVMVRLDGGNWTRATGATAWSLQIGMDELDDGHHTLEAISYDGLMYSPVSSVEFEYAHEVQAGEGSWLWLVLVIVVIVVLCGVAVNRFFKQNELS